MRVVRPRLDTKTGITITDFPLPSSFIRPAAAVPGVYVYGDLSDDRRRRFEGGSMVYDDDFHLLLSTLTMETDYGRTFFVPARRGKWQSVSRASYPFSSVTKTCHITSI